MFLKCIELHLSASLTFTEGVLADAIPWDLLNKQLVTRSEYGWLPGEMCECSST